jgi:hypothetical protein
LLQKQPIKHLTEPKSTQLFSQTHQSINHTQQAPTEQISQANGRMTKLPMSQEQ